MFFLIILQTNAVNAFANAPRIPTYIRIDDAYYDWYLHKFGIALDRSLVLLANHALQGHPESPRLWEEHINHILITVMGFHNTTHERSIYSGTYQGHRVLIKRQVDNLAVAAPTIKIAQAIIDDIGKHIKLDGNSLLTKFNGIEVNQTSNYINLHCSSYINKILHTHNWDTPSPSDTSIRKPLHASLVKQIDTDIGPPEHSPKAIVIANDAGFSYRQLLGELMYAYVICRLDIGYVLTKLAQFSTSPAAVHYTCLCRIAIYLCNTQHWGIVFWQPKPMESLPAGPIVPLQLSDTTLPIFPACQPTQLQGFVDAAHATDMKTRRSVTGYVIVYGGAAICYRSKLQSTVATSSTEAEFIAAVTASKAVKYIRSVLFDLGLDYAQSDPTPMFEDNEAAINMINASKPTTCLRHIDIQFFAIQEWKLKGDIIFHHIPGIINSSDAMTKALGWILHYCHATRAMGHYHPSYILASHPELSTAS